MGCCMSSTATRGNSLRPKTPSDCHSPADRGPSQEPNKIPTPPPDSPEEETVKEVLSETPILRPQFYDQNNPTLNNNNQIPTFQERETQAPIFVGNNHEEEEEEKTPEVSQVSETCSTLSTATTTTTITEIREDEATSKRRFKRSPVGAPRIRPSVREREGAVKSPVKREKLVANREFSGQLRTRAHNVGSSRVRKDFGEGSEPRLRSPASTGGGAGRGGAWGSSATVTEMAGVETVEAGMGSWAKRDDGNGDVLMQQPQVTESLENPVVSLECFIFL